MRRQSRQGTPFEHQGVGHSEQAAAYQDGWNAAKAEYIPVLMEHLRILADLRAQVEALPVQWQALGEVWVKRTQVLALFDVPTRSERQEPA